MRLRRRIKIALRSPHDIPVGLDSTVNLIHILHADLRPHITGFAGIDQSRQLGAAPTQIKFRHVYIAKIFLRDHHPACCFSLDTQFLHAEIHGLLLGSQAIRRIPQVYNEQSVITLVSALRQIINAITLLRVGRYFQTAVPIRRKSVMPVFFDLLQ